MADERDIPSPNRSKVLMATGNDSNQETLRLLADVTTKRLLVNTTGAGTEYTEDAATPSAISGFAGMMERDDALGTLTPAEGDWAAFRCSAEGALWTQDFNSDTLVTNTTDLPNVIGTDGSAGPSKAVSIAGTESGGTLQELLADSDGHLQVDVLSGGAGTEYNEDDPTPATISGIANMMERDDVLGSLTPAEGDWASLRCSAEGALWVQDFNSDAITASLAIMDDWDESDRAKVNVIVGQAGIAAGAGAVGVTVPRVTLASDDPAVVSLQLLDNALYVDDAAWTDDTSSHLLAGGLYQSSPQTITDGRVAPFNMTVNGAIHTSLITALPAGSAAIGKLAANSGVDIGDVDVTSVPSALQGDGNPTIDSITHVAINVGAGATDTVLVSSAASKQIWVYSIMITANVAGTVSIQDQDDAAITGVVQLGATGGYSVAPSGNFAMPIWKLGTDKDLEMDTVTCEVDGFLTYAIVSV